MRTKKQTNGQVAEGTVGVKVDDEVQPLPDEPVVVQPPREADEADEVGAPVESNVVRNPILADAINRVQAVLAGNGQASNPALLLGQAVLKNARLEEALSIAIETLGALTQPVKEAAEP